LTRTRRLALLGAAFNKGGTVDLPVQSDTADEVHFHGYDVHKEEIAKVTVEP
jgi:hypothetical protein